MSGANHSKLDEKPNTRWHLSLIPLYMAIGSPGLLVTLIALDLGASVALIGVMTAAGAAASVILSIVWGRFSDYTGRRKIFLLSFFVILSPIFIVLTMANNVPQLILLYTLVSGIISGVSPIAIMYTVECYKHGKWESGIARYNAITNIGVTLGLITFSIAAQFYKTNELFYISSATCIIGALLFWLTAKEPEITLERNHFSLQITHNLERFLSANSILHYFKIPRINLLKNLRQLKPVQLLFLASFVHWFGMSMAWLGQTPLIKVLGLSDSLILTINIVSNLATALAFIWISRRAKSSNISSINRILVVRCGLVLCWAALPIIFFHSVIIVFVFSLTLNILTSMLYAMIWLPLSTFAISQTPADRRGGVQGELSAAIGVAMAFGSFFGGLVTEAFGYSIGFILASTIVMLSIPIFSRIDI